MKIKFIPTRFCRFYAGFVQIAFIHSSWTRLDFSSALQSWLCTALTVAQFKGLFVIHLLWNSQKGFIYTDHMNGRPRCKKSSVIHLKLYQSQYVEQHFFWPRSSLVSWHFTLKRRKAKGLHCSLPWKHLLDNNSHWLKNAGNLATTRAGWVALEIHQSQLSTVCKTGH